MKREKKRKEKEAKKLARAENKNSLDDDSMIPEALRAGYRLLKNSGYLPPELQLQREIREVEDLLAQTQEAAERSACEKRLRLLRARLGESGRGASRLLELGRYHDRLLEKWEGD